MNPIALLKRKDVWAAVSIILATLLAATYPVQELVRWINSVSPTVQVLVAVGIVYLYLKIR